GGGRLRGLDRDLAALENARLKEVGELVFEVRQALEDGAADDRGRGKGQIDAQQGNHGGAFHTADYTPTARVCVGWRDRRALQADTRALHCGSCPTRALPCALSCLFHSRIPRVGEWVCSGVSSLRPCYSPVFGSGKDRHMRSAVYDRLEQLLQAEIRKRYIYSVL